MLSTKKDDFFYSILTWVLLSILLHILLTQALLLIKMHRSHQESLTPPENAKHETRYVLMMPEKPQPEVTPPPTQTQSKSKPVAQKTPSTAAATPEPIQPLSAFTLIPGQKGIDAQNLPETINQAPTPQQQVSKPQVPTSMQNLPPESMIQPAVESKKIACPSATKSLQDAPALRDSKFMQTESINFKTHKPEYIQESNNSTPPTALQEAQKFVPEIKHNISFKDVNLGFTDAFTNVGNNDSIFNIGSTSHSPDRRTFLRYKTYLHQLQKTIAESIQSHPNIKLLPRNFFPQTGRFRIRVDRNGKLLESGLSQTTGNILYDRILIESIQCIRLFPSIPKFIPDETFSIEWFFAPFNQMNRNVFDMF